MTNPPTQPVNVNVQTGAGGEIIRIVATLLLFGSLGVLLWVFAQGPMADQIGVATTAALSFFAVQLWKRGVIGAPSLVSGAGQRSAAARLDSLTTNFLRRCGLPFLLIIAVAYGLVFLGVRSLFAVVLGDYISVGVTAAVIFLASQIWERRAAGLPLGGQPRRKTEPAPPLLDDLDDFEWWRAKLARSTTGAGDFLQRCHPAMLAAAAIGYGVAIVLLRVLVTLGLSAFHNLYLSGALAGVVATFVIKPDLLKGAFEALCRAGVIRTGDETASATAPTPVPAPAPATPAPASVPRLEQQFAAPKRVRRVVKIKKESTDV